MVFACSNKFWKSMNKNDKRIINQYIATKQGQSLYQADMSLLQVLDKEKKLVDNRFMLEHEVSEINIYLKK